MCVGLGKTGTTSLATFLSQLGLKHYSNFNDARQYYSGNTEYFLSLAERHDSFDDIPWCFLFEVLDMQHDCLFVLSVRDSEDEWYGSLCRHFDRFGPSVVDYLTYGFFNPHGRREHYTKFYRDHVTRVKLYFADKSNLLVFNARHQGCWVALCDALGVVFDASLVTVENRDNRTNLEKTIQSIASLEGLDKATSIVDQGVLSFAQETYIAARQALGKAFQNRLRFLDLQRETKFLDRASVVDPISRTHFLPKRMHDVPNPSVLFVTMCKNEEFFIDRWIRHHKCEVKNAQFLVLDDGSSDRTCAIARAHDRVALVSLPTFGQFDDEHRGKSISMLVGAFNAFFDYTIYLDADEFLVCDRDVYYGLDDFLRRNRVASRSAVGVEVVQHRQSEAALGSQDKFLDGRSYGVFSGNYSKPIIQSGPVVFSPGFHFSETEAILAEAVYILHMRFVDTKEFERRYQVRQLVCKSARQVENRRGEHWGTKSGLFDALDAAIEQQNISDWGMEKERFMKRIEKHWKSSGFFEHDFGLVSNFCVIPDSIRRGLHV